MCSCSQAFLINAKLENVTGKVRQHGAATRTKRARPPSYIAYMSDCMFELRNGFTEKNCNAKTNTHLQKVHDVSGLVGIYTVCIARQPSQTS